MEAAKAAETDGEREAFDPIGWRGDHVGINRSAAAIIGKFTAAMKPWSRDAGIDATVAACALWLQRHPMPTEPATLASADTEVSATKPPGRRKTTSSRRTVVRKKLDLAAQKTPAIAVGRGPAEIGEGAAKSR
jgi:hypothetical protein